MIHGECVAQTTKGAKSRPTSCVCACGGIGLQHSISFIYSRDRSFGQFFLVGL